MVKKKKLLGLLVGVLLLTSCNNKKLPGALVFGDLPSTFLKNNAVEYHETAFKGYSQVRHIEQYDKFGHTIFMKVSGGLSSSYSLRQQYTLFGVEKEEEMFYGVYDLIKQQEVLPANYVNILLKDVTYFDAANNKEVKHVYAYLSKFSSPTYINSVYNVTEKMQLVADLPAEISWGHDIQTRREGNYTVETITSINIMDDATKKVSKVLVGSDGKLVRSPYEPEDETELVQAPRNYFVDSPSLLDYSYEATSTSLIGFLGETQIFEVVMPLLPLNSIMTVFVLDQYMYMQQSTLLPQDAEKYTYYSGTNKYNMTTSRIDLKTGKVSDVKKFPYVISASFNGGRVVLLQKDDFGQYKYGILSISKIENKVLLQNQVVLFDAQLNPLANLTALNFTMTYYDLGSGYFLTQNKEIVNAKHKRVVNLALYENIQFIPATKLISLRYNGDYGVIDRNGKIIVPFNYLHPFNFYNDNALNYNNNTSAWQKISASGNEIAHTSLKRGEDLTLSYFSFSSDYLKGLLYNRASNKDYFYNYDGKELLKLEYASVAAISSANILYENGDKFGMMFRVLYSNSDVEYYSFY